MLSDEEREAIEYIENCLDDEYDYKNATRQKDKKAHNIILNLIKKQSKEIEELKEGRLTLFDTTVKNSIKINDKRWKDKIKAKIEEVSNGTYDAKIVLQSLLEKE